MEKHYVLAVIIDGPIYGSYYDVRVKSPVSPRRAVSLAGQTDFFEWVSTPGYGHVWTIWRVYLRDLPPKLFEGN